VSGLCDEQEQAMSDTAETDSAKSRRLGRSPAYPSFSIAKALENVKALYVQEKEYAAPLASALKAFGYGPKSSGGRQALATMKYYGLIDVTGEGDGRRIKASDIALKILRDPREDETEKRQNIFRVAMTPTAHKLLHEEYQDGLASDGTVLHHLHGLGFNEAAARELLDEFKDTASYIGLYESRKSVDKAPVKEDSRVADDVPPAVEVGDMIQWVLNGADQFPDGALVEAVHPSGTWLWVSEKHTKSGIPMEQVELLEHGKADPGAPPPRPATVSQQGGGDTPVDLTKKPKVTLDDDVMTIVASVKMTDLPSLKKKIEALEAFYNAG
jgi:hypothetical protein